MVGPRVYDIDEANTLIPALEEQFAQLDDIRSRLRQAKIKLQALEMIWGGSLNDDDNPDHQEGLSLLAEMKKLEESFGGVIERINGLGATVKDFDQGLVDLYHVRDGHLVFLCWKRGEEEIGAWHHVDEGYAGRQSL